MSLNWAAQLEKHKDTPVSMSNGDAITDGGFIMLPNVVLRSEILSMSAKLLYGVLQAIYYKHIECSGSQRDLATLMSMSSKTVTAAIKELHEHGFAHQIHRGLGRPAVYELQAVFSKQTRKIKIKTDSGIELEGADDITRFGYTLLPLHVLFSEDLNSGEKIAYATVLSFAFGDKREVTVLQETLGRYIGKERRTIGRYMQRLQDCGMMTVKRNGDMIPNTYVLNVKVPPSKDLGQDVTIRDTGITLAQSALKKMGLRASCEFVKCRIIGRKIGLRRAVANDADDVVKLIQNGNTSLIDVDWVRQNLRMDIHRFQGSYKLTQTQSKNGLVQWWCFNLEETQN